MRKAGIAMVAGFGKRLRCIACVIEGSGFRAAVTRSVLAGMSLLIASRSLDVKFTATTGEAATWVAERREVSVATLLRAHQQLKSSMGARAL